MRRRKNVKKLEEEREKTFKIKELMTIMFFDIQKVYDSMWRDGIA